MRRKGDNFGQRPLSALIREGAMPRQARLDVPGTLHINAKEGKMQSAALKREAKKAILIHRQYIKT